MTRPITATPATEQNILLSEDQQTEYQPTSAALDLAVQVIPSGDVITLLPVPVIEVAQNNLNSGDQQIPRQSLFTAAALLVHSMPLGDVATRSPVPP